MHQPAAQHKVNLISGDTVVSWVGFGAFNVLESIAEPAQPFAAAARIRALQPCRAWVICPHVRLQELLHHDLAIWGVNCHFFPEMEFSGYEDALPDPATAAERLGILAQLGSDKSESMTIVVCEDSLADTVPAAESLRNDRIDLKTGDGIDLPSFRDALTEAGYEKTSRVYQHGQFAVRGGIVDVFAWQQALPLRIELFGDEIDSMREFDPEEQVSVGRLTKASILLGAATREQHCRLTDYIAPEDLVIAVDCAQATGAAAIYSTAKGSDPPHACYANPLGFFDAGDFILQEARRSDFIRQVNEWHADGWRIVMFFHSEGELERFEEMAGGDFIADGIIQPALGGLGRGFTLPFAKLAVLADAEIFGRYQHLRTRRLAEKRLRQKRVSGESDLRSYDAGDLVIHQEYGLGRFRELAEKDGQEVLVIEYADRAKLYVPAGQGHLVSRYVGVGKNAPPLNKLGGGRWRRTREKTEKSIMDYAAHLLSTQAQRSTQKAYSHQPDTRWQWEFENSFLYQETPDQLLCIEAAKQDMESAAPMDRLICGDVGFGKTEVAIRAAFKAVMSGRQVAVLVPTTVLAQQHYHTFRERMSDYPVVIEMLSRYRTPAQQRKTVAAVANGSIDVVIGTHRLISKDIAFKRLGLVVIDEEQRFGVRHKERFKELFEMVDVLTLSATPIPRTLYLSLMGVKDMSTIDTPPPNRIPVATTICPYDERIIKKAIERELKRQGQIFFLHNRVKTIGRFKEKIEHLCPRARVEIGHGQMDEGALEQVMNRFVANEFDVLVSTTIIESGVDIPNANTIIIDRADRFGLADLYQLRGRVGRSGKKAYAILMIPRDLVTVGDARRRISAIKQYTALGSGFKIAMRDLEIRGAGNLLGTEQSGHITAVGFDLYCRLLKRSIAKLKGQTAARSMDVAVSLDFLCNSEAEYAANPARRLAAYIPSSYMEDARDRITGYRELAEAESLKELRGLTRNWQDRFGKHPDEVEHLLLAAELKLRCAHQKISVCETKGDKLMLTRRGKGVQTGGKYPRLKEPTPKGRLLEAIEFVKVL